MLRVTPYWTQKGLIANYYKMRRSPDEKLLVWQMYWRGENFYTQNEIYEGPKEERTVFLGDKQRREPQGLDGEAPRPARVLPGRADAAAARSRPRSRPTRARR